MSSRSSKSNIQTSKLATHSDSLKAYNHYFFTSNQTTTSSPNFKMSFFHRTTGGDFAPLFRLLDDYDTHRSTSTAGRKGHSACAVTNFAPRFDVRESEASYHLDGELPGINQKDIEIEFSDPQTLVIKGRSVREYNNTNTNNDNSNDEAASANSPKPVNVEDESEPEYESVEQAPAKTVAAPSKKHNYKYWVSERSVGQFHRSFNFPNRVDQDAVKANLSNGILSIVVPKAAPPVSRKINIE